VTTFPLLYLRHALLLIKKIRSLGFYEGRASAQLNRATDDMENVSAKVTVPTRRLVQSRIPELKIVERRIPSEEHAQNGSRPRRPGRVFLRCMAARDSALCAFEERKAVEQDRKELEALLAEK